MKLRRRNLRKGLVAVGCVVGSISWPAWGLGLLSLGLGCALHLWTKGVLEQNRRLTTAGPYRWTRNPFYLANFLIDAGLCGVIGSVWLSGLYLVVWMGSYLQTIAREEDRLRHLFGEEFDRYRSKVPRLLPTLRPLPRGEASGAFSWSNPSLAQGREYARLLGVVLAAGAIWAAAVLRREGLDILEPDRAVERGLIGLLAAGWIVKLALAETFRRPEVSLLPRALGARMRGLVALGASLPLLLAVDPEMLERTGVCLGSGLLVSWAVAGASAGAMKARSAWIGWTIACVAVLGFGALWQAVGLAVLPALWLALSALDDLGRLRQGLGTGPKRVSWAVLPRVLGLVIGVVTSLQALSVAIP